MSTPIRWSGLGIVSLVAIAAVLGSVDRPFGRPAQAASPSGQTYVGTKNCASCHFEQYMTWKKTKHAKSFEVLPQKYKTNEGCLKCHTTGFGEATGFKDAASSENLAGNTCESCHGPSSEHAKVAQQFAAEKSLNDEQKKQIKESVTRLVNDSCARCHLVASHRAHEKFDKD
jgi:hypothetical protein